MKRKTVLITGASRGIGKSIAYHFGKNGYNLVLCSLTSKELLDTIKNQLESLYSIKVLTFTGDIGDYKKAKELFHELDDKFGSLDVIVNNAGISYVGLLTDMSIEDWNRIIQTNLTSVFNCSKLGIPYMVSKKSGKIINISSVWGNIGASCEVAYSATKGGINAFTKALAKELAPSNIQVNAIACGVIDTEMNNFLSHEERNSLITEIPSGRFGNPEEVAELTYQLTCGHSYLTGQIITLDGGWM